MQKIDYSTGCSRSTCIHKDDCVLYANYQRQRAAADVLNLINDNRVEQSDEGCSYHTVARSQRTAYGFMRLAYSIPFANVPHLRRLCNFSSDASYYRYRRGDRGLSPSAQQTLLAHIKALGGNPNIPFDSYRDEIIYVTNP